MTSPLATQRLIAILERTAAQQRQTLTLLAQQHEAMVARNLTRLGDLAGELVELAGRTQEIEQERAALTRQLALPSNPDPSNASLREIAASIDDPDASARLLELRDELLDLHGQVSAARDRNQALAGDILAANDATLRALMDALRETGYGPDAPPRVIDRRA